MCGNSTTFAMKGQQVVKWFAGTATVKPNDVQWISGAEFKRAFPSEARGFNYDLLKLTPIVDNRTYAIGAVGSSVRPITRRVIFVDTDKPTKCGAMCRNAKGPMCDCSCKGENHGASAAMARSRFSIADIDLQPTQEMADNAERGLKLREKHGRGGTAVGVARARDIKNRKNLSADTVKRMHSFFSRHEGNQAGGEDDAGFIAWLLWGGDSGKAWAARKVVQIEKIESAPRAVRKSTMAANKYLPADEIVHSFNDGWTVVKRWDGYAGKYGLILTNKGKQNIRVDSLNEAKQRHDSINHWIFRATIVENKPNEFLIQATKADGGWALGDRGGKPFKTKDAAQKSLEKQQADQRRKLGMSRHGKATMAKKFNDSFTVQLRWNGMGAPQHRAAFKTLAEAEKEAERLHRLYGSLGNPEFPTMKGIVEMEIHDGEQPWKNRTVRWFASRSGKAAFSNGERNRRMLQVLAEADRRIANQVVSNIAAHYGIPTQQVFDEIFDAGAENLMDYVTEPVRSAASVILQKRGMMSRPGTKSAFDAFNPFTAPAKPASWDGKRITLNNKMYKVEPNGDVYDLYDMNTNKKAKTVTAEQLYRAWSQGRITSIYSRFGAKAAFAANNVDLWNFLARNDTSIARQNKNDLAVLKKYAQRALTMPDFTPPSLAQHGPSLHTMAKEVLAEIKAWEEQVYRQRNRAPWDASRSGAKETHMKNGMKAAMSATPHKITYTDKSGVTHTYMVSDKILRAMNGTKRYAESVGSKPDYGSVLRLGERTGEVVRASRSGARAQFDLRAKVAQMKTMVSKLVTTLGFKPDEVTGNEQMMHILFLNKPKQADRLAAALRTNLARVGVPNSAITTHENYYADENTTYGGVWIDLTALANAAGKMSRSGARAEFAEPNSFRDLVAYARFKFNLNLYQAQDVAGRAGLFLQMYPNKYTLEQAMAEALRRSNAQLTTEQKAPNYQVGGNTVGNQSIRDRSLVMSRSGAKAAFAEELIQKLSGGWEIVKIDGILHLAKGNEAIPVPNVQRAMELHKASTEGRLMKENVAGTKTQAFSRVGEEEAFEIGASSEVEDPTKDEQLIALANRVGREHTVNLFKCWSEGKASMGYAQ